MTALDAALDALFADGNIAHDGIYIAEGGAPQLVRVVTRRADEVTGFGDARLWSETTRVDLRVTEVANPRPGERIEIDGEVSCCRFRGHEDKIVTKESEIGNETEVYERVQV